jgi:cytochrome c biogenesis protein CcmG, thiol:disulfide interchange protein DsbE
MSNRPRVRPDGARRLPTAAVVIAAVVVVALGLVLAIVRGGDDGGAASARAFGAVEVAGEALPTLGGTRDPATGVQAPLLRLEDPYGGTEAVGGPGEAVLVVFLAHWCPHCQAEVPVLVEMARDGAFEGSQLVAVLTGTNREAPNFPPVAWLEREGWPGRILLDDDDATAAAAYGLDGYPFVVVVDGGGRVVARASGEQPPEAIEAMLEAAGAPAGP